MTDPRLTAALAMLDAAEVYALAPGVADDERDALVDQVSREFPRGTAQAVLDVIEERDEFARALLDIIGAVPERYRTDATRVALDKARKFTEGT